MRSQGSFQRNIQERMVAIYQTNERHVRPISIREEKALDVLLSFIEDPHPTTRRKSQEHAISKESIHNILKGNNFHPFKVKLVYERIVST